MNEFVQRHSDGVRLDVCVLWQACNVPRGERYYHDLVSLEDPPARDAVAAVRSQRNTQVEMGAGFSQRQGAETRRGSQSQRETESQGERESVRA